MLFRHNKNKTDPEDIKQVHNIYNCIRNRRSIRSYKNQKIDPNILDVVLKAATWAPSGKNGQPWKICVIHGKKLRDSISDLSIYKKWMKTAPCMIAFFLDKEKSCNYIKDVLSSGAAIQNLLITAYDYGLGTCWIGELNDKSSEVKNILNIENDQLELMGIITIGFPAGEAASSGRKALAEFLL